MTKKPERLTLKKALQTNRLAAFIAQEESRGVKPVDCAEFEKALRIIATQPRSTGQTSRSASRGDSSEK